ncbi:5'-Nucleotidase domain protein [Chloroherpeton thalassium ATCC 35110]|uniref:5'-Nucleotidase domain protein n=1 Tax=Chloroherpeton thalassium (strain ATCC 35110 / GB-78) TaxID=517418 RepID=B3QU15_CHLT3|nr:choice-of-anchor I family protein [Chloroherpeton thalassium]ACF12813.1 5'-Nucleotidase domain protein [Chloroherpeton thalassium ATCC 35110]
MKRKLTHHVKQLLSLMVLIAATCLRFTSAQAQDVSLTKLSTYATGIFDESAAEIASYDATTGYLAFVNAHANEVVVLDLSDPANPSEVRTLDVTTEVAGGSANSVSAKNGVLAVAVEADTKTDNGYVVLYDASSGNHLKTLSVGALPDMVAFTPDGNKILVANEGEPNDDYSIDPEGSVSIIDISSGASNATVQTLNFNDFDDQKANLIAAGVRIFGADASNGYSVASFSAVDTIFYSGFDNADLAGFDTVSVVGEQVWGTTSYGTPKPSGMMTGYANSTRNDNEDWLIIPAMDFTGKSGVKLSFTEAINYETVSVDDNQQVLISTDYTGFGDPNAATWDTLNVTNRSTGSSWTFVTVDDFDLSDYEGESSVYIAFKYISSATDNNASTWEIDDITVQADNATIQLTDASGITAGQWITLDSDNSDEDTDAVLPYQVLSVDGNTICLTTGFESSFDGDKFEEGTDTSANASAWTVYSHNTTASVSKDLEPEYIAITPDSKTAYVSCQENNAFVIIDIDNATVSSIKALGFKDHSVAGNGLDASDKDDMINITTYPNLKGMYMPDATVAYEIGGATYIFTANEGDAREYDALIEEVRVQDLPLDPTAFPDAEDLQKKANLGRLTVTNTLGDIDGDGDFDELYSYGARSFSIWDTDGNLVWDSGDQIEKAAAVAYPSYFNSGNDDKGELDDRSDNKGPEPEAMAVGKIGDHVYAFVGLERIGGVMIFDVTNPTSPSFKKYINNRDFTVDPSKNLSAAGDLGPECVVFIPADSRTDGKNLLAVANEISGTVSIYEISAPETYTLTILHNNDGESALLSEDGYAGISHFKSAVDSLKKSAMESTDGVVMLSSGDNFLAGKEFSASLNDGIYYDAIGLDFIDYDAICLGNHDFDFGPKVLSDFIQTIQANPAPYLSSNIDFSGESDLQTLVDNGRIAKRTVFEKNGRKIGVIGATTENLKAISSPGDVVMSAVKDAVMAQVNAIKDTVDIIILISHLQSVEEDKELAAELSNVDVMIAGGGDEVLASEIAELYPGDSRDGDYPTIVTDADGKEVPIVTTGGNYKYVGKLVVSFDDNGDIVNINSLESDPVLVKSSSYPTNVGLETNVITPVSAYIASLENNVIAVTEVALDGKKSHVRTQETNAGNLVADALLWQGRQLAADYGATVPNIGMENGGGIRNDVTLEAGDNITSLTTFDMLPFSNYVSIIEVTHKQLKAVLENAVSRVEYVDGRFAQIAGMRVYIDTTAAAREQDDETGVATVEGSRITKVVLFAADGSDSTTIIENGVVATPTEKVAVATNNFSAAGGDGYPWMDSEFITVGVSYQQALENYLVAENGLDSVVSADMYPVVTDDVAESKRRIIYKTGTSAVAGETEKTPATYALEQNYPNPFNPTTTINYTLASSGFVTLKVYDILGREVATLVNEQMKAGQHIATFNAARFASGVYFYRLKAGEFVKVKKMMLLK